jgi:hypothetical protein
MCGPKGRYTINLGQYLTPRQNVCVCSVLLCSYYCGDVVMEQWNCLLIRVQKFKIMLVKLRD